MSQFISNQIYVSLGLTIDNSIAKENRRFRKIWVDVKDIEEMRLIIHNFSTFITRSQVKSIMPVI